MKQNNNGAKSASSRQQNTAAAAGKRQTKNKSEDLMKLFQEELKDIYGAEKQLSEALPEVIEAVENTDLKEAFTDHLAETKEHAKRIEKVFSMLSIDREEKKCKAMEGLIQEAKDIIKEFEAGSVRDCALIIGAQKIEHYEIATYGSLCELAEVLGKHRVSNILDTTLEEEENADRNLTALAEMVNDEAMETIEDAGEAVEETNTVETAST